MNELRIKTCVVGAVSTNCYVMYREGGDQAVIVDPGDQAQYLSKLCRELGVKVTAILLTHGHFDHILAAKDLKKEWGCSIYAGMEEAGLLADFSMNLSGTMGSEPMELEPDVLLRDGESFDLLGFSWKMITTPGHTAGSVCYWIPEEETLISGDTLFAESLGRTDLPTSSSAAIISSISKKLFCLPEETMVYPGHGEPTSIGHEKQYNPVAVYLRRR